MQRTTVSMTKQTRDRLKALGQKGETYDELINRLIDAYHELEQRKTTHGVDFEPVG